MSKVLTELVGFIGSPNPQIRLLALENLVPYSTAEPTVFKTNELLPVKQLKAAARQRPEIAEHALMILLNLSGDRDVLENLATDDEFVKVILSRVIDPAERNADTFAMLLANLAKRDSMKSIVSWEQTAPSRLGSDSRVINQLVDLFVKGADKSYNEHADYDYLAYLFADLAKHAEARQHFAARQAYDSVIPLTKIRVFTEHKSDVRRLGVASTIKNLAFDTPSNHAFLAADEINILPYVLLPIMGGEEYDDDEAMAMLPDLQLLPPDKQRERDPRIIQTHIETLTLLTTTREGRDLMREVQVYPIIRETHLRVDDDGVREACDRLVQVLMRDEEEPGVEARGEAIEAKDDDDDDEDDEIVEV